MIFHKAALAVLGAVCSVSGAVHPSIESDEPCPYASAGLAHAKAQAASALKEEDTGTDHLSLRGLTSRNLGNANRFGKAKGNGNAKDNDNDNAKGKGNAKAAKGDNDGNEKDNGNGNGNNPPGPSPVDIELTPADFATGTYRIRQSGTYRLTDHIEFCPNPADNYWPTRSQWAEYPPAAFYLGFYAAITIEADDVEIDLAGFTIQQCEEFYLLQRFFNVIQLNNRAFVANEGVASLNYQSTDVPASNGGVAGDLITPSNVLIKNGIIGRSSHNGIHGNSITDLTIEDVRINTFEVAGIQCNGCKHVTIRNSGVGPSSREVPAIATWSNSRFLEFYTKTLIPEGFANEPVAYRANLLGMLDDPITFADRPNSPTTIQAVFDRNSKAVDLFKMYKFGEDLSTLESDEEALLEEAKGIFNNPYGTPDGGALYGILVNRRGVPVTDDNFNGAGRESENITIANVHVQGLHANPVEVISLMTEEGSHMQGPVRDLLRVFDVTTDRMRTLLDSRYKGNFLSDVYFALWQLSNSFYVERVFDSTCGNFGSNASFPFNLKTYPSDNYKTCTQNGTSSDPALTGRLVTMLQKQYFGGLQMSQGIFDWATSKGGGLDALLETPASQDILRSGARHKIVCDHDTMFHPNHGVVGVKVVEAKDVTVTGLQMDDLLNTADEQLWVCRNPWQLQPTGEDIMAVTAALDSGAGSTTRGIEVVRSERVHLDTVTVENLRSDEGAIIGIEVMGDGNDRTDHADDMGVSFEGVTVQNLSGPGGAMPLKSSATTLAMPSGLSAGPPEETDTSLNNPRMIMNYQMTNARSPRTPGKLPALTFTNEEVLIDMKQTTTLDTDKKIKDFRRRVLAFYKEHYGMKFDEPSVYDAPLLDPITVYDNDGNPTDSVVQLGQLSHDTEYHATGLCITDGNGGAGECTDEFVGLVHDFAFNFFPGDSGYTFYGAFGGDHGKFCPRDNIIWVGLYSFENVDFPGVNEDANLQVEYYGECPTPVVQLYGEKVSFYINCAVESDIFGKGMATGAYVFEPTKDGKEWKLNGYPSMIFDEQQLNPQISPKHTDLFDSEIPNVDTNDWRFSFIADGKFPTQLSAVEAVSFGHMHHYTHEAGIEYLKLRTSYNTDEKIRALRKQFLTRLKNTFGININPQDFDDIPLDGVVDLGGRNLIMPYVVNEDANQRIMTKRGHDGPKVAAMPPASRMHEGGFRFVVGRAGIQTNDEGSLSPGFGQIPFGSTWLEGVYIVEDGDTNWEIDFYCDAPVQLNGWATGVVYQHLNNPTLGDGLLYSLAPLPVREADGLLLGMRGVMVFGNLDENK